jgi:uncharacterized protein YndB with AHSA1/START domain
MNAELQTIKKSITIQAPRKKVWEVLHQDQLTRQWYAEFGEGTKAETEWLEGSKVSFTDSDGNGILAKVTDFKPYDLISVEFLGFVAGGQEDFESEGAKAVKGGQETYRLTEKDGGTHLAIEADMGNEWADQMAKAWDKALVKIKDLAESKGV